MIRVLAYNVDKLKASILLINSSAWFSHKGLYSGEKQHYLGLEELNEACIR